MADRVLSTTTAKASISKMQSIITGPLMENINGLNSEGQTLSDPNVWDGTLAQKFRGQWPEMHNALQKAQQAVEQLRQQIQQINENIMTAGGS